MGRKVGSVGVSASKGNEDDASAVDRNDEAGGLVERTPASRGGGLGRKWIKLSCAAGAEECQIWKWLHGQVQQVTAAGG